MRKAVQPRTTYALFKPALLLAISVSLSCSTEPLPTDLELESQASLTAVAGGTISTLTNFQAWDSPELPESITLDGDGNIYVSMSSLREVWKLDSEGNKLAVLASFELETPDNALKYLGVHGLKLDQNGNLFVAVASTIPEMRGVWKISPDGSKERVAGTGNMINPNDLAIESNGTLYITDSNGSVWRSLPGKEATQWVQHEHLVGDKSYSLGVRIGATGIVVTNFSGKGKTASVVVSNSEKGQLVSIPVLPDGSAGEPEIYTDGVFGIDGLTIDQAGDIYGAIMWDSKIVKISRNDRSVTELATGNPLNYPNSLAFGKGKTRNSLFIANFSIKDYTDYRNEGKTPTPGILTLELDR